VSQFEPGVDRHIWESEWQALEPAVEDSPREALPELEDLIERMLVARGYQLDEEVTLEGAEPEIVREFMSARDITRRSEAGEAGPGDVAQAIESYRTLYGHLIEGAGP
jgi:hypothetical protein